jgi:hypothetical protein
MAKDQPSPENARERSPVPPQFQVRFPLLREAGWLHQKYIEEGRSTRSIAEELGCCQQTVWRALRRLGVEMRPPRSPQPTHGQRGSLTYRSWKSMKQRILNPQCDSFKNYGGRGLTIKPEWAASYEAFRADVGERPAPHLSIDRIDNDLGYLRGNVKWSTRSEQSRNQRPRKKSRAVLTAAWPTMNRNPNRRFP